MPRLGKWFSAEVTAVKRSQGQSATAGAAYDRCERIHDERTGITHDYRAKGGLVARFTVAPADAPEWVHDSEKLWNAAELAEKKVNGRPARELRLALPFEASMDDRLTIAHRVASELRDHYGVAVTVGVHEPSKEGDQRNFHAHIQFTTREVTEDGLGAKTRVLDDLKTGPDEITAIRKMCADVTNDVLSDAGSDEYVSHLSNKELGIDEEPQVHMGPVATARKRRGERADREVINQEIAEENADRLELDQLVDELADLNKQIAAATAEEFEDDLLLSKSGAKIRDGALGLFDQVHDAPAYTLHGLHREMLAKAGAEITIMAAEKASEWTDAVTQRVGRIGQWWENMRHSFVEWRDHLQESVTSWWDKNHPPEQQPDATPQQAASDGHAPHLPPTPPPAPPMEPSQ